MPTGLLPSTAQVLPPKERGPKQNRALVVLGVIAIAVSAVAAIVTVATRDDGPSSDPLFVLPDPVGEWALADGTVTEPALDPPGTAERFVVRGSLYGRGDGRGYDGLRSTVQYTGSPLPGATWESDVTNVGDAYRRVDDSITFAVEEWEGEWRVVSSPSDLVHAHGMLANDTTGLTLLDEFAPPAARDVPTTSFVMTAPDGSTFTVDTSAASPLFDVATFAERIEPIDIDGTAGWIVIDERDEGTVTAVTWSLDGRTVTVRSSAARDAVVDAARMLQPVSPDRWTTAFPASQID
jgi:hypothetical protein